MNFDSLFDIGEVLVNIRKSNYQSMDRKELVKTFKYINVFLFGSNYNEQEFNHNQILYYKFIDERITFDDLMKNLFDKLNDKHSAYAYQVIKKYNKAYKCMYPQCTTDAIGSHNMQENGVLKRLNTINDTVIVDENHVYMPVLKRTGRNESKIFLELQGIATQATRFPGFCNSHDTKIFKPIEEPYNDDYQNNTFKINENEAFLFSYRAFALSNWKNINRYNSFQHLKKEKEELGFIPTHYIDYSEDGHIMERLHQEYLHNKVKFDDILLNNDTDKFENFSFYCIEINYEISFAVSTSTAINLNCYGDYLNNIDKVERNPFCFINIFPYIDKSFIVLGWFKEHDFFYKELIDGYKELLKQKEGLKKILNFYNNFLPMFIKNIAISPRLRENFKSAGEAEFLSVVNDCIGKHSYEIIQDNKHSVTDNKSYNLFANIKK